MNSRGMHNFPGLNPKAMEQAAMQAEAAAVQAEVAEHTRKRMQMESEILAANLAAGQAQSAAWAARATAADEERAFWAEKRREEDEQRARRAQERAEYEAEIKAEQEARTTRAGSYQAALDAVFSTMTQVAAGAMTAQDAIPALGQALAESGAVSPEVFKQVTQLVKAKLSSTDPS